MRLFGKNTVIERLRANPASVRQVFIQQGLSDVDHIVRKAKEKGLPISYVPQTKMIKWGRNINTQGVMVDVEDFSYKDYNLVLEEALERKRTLFFLDDLTDPQNLGAILRSLACIGRFAVILPTHDSVSVTESVLRVASGADNYVPVCRVANLGNAIKKAKEAGVWIIGTVVKEGQSMFETQFQHPLGIVIGSEQKGIRDIIKRHLDAAVTIPMVVETLSFNVAQAATIIAYEITKQKKTKRPIATADISH